MKFLHIILLVTLGSICSHLYADDQTSSDESTIVFMRSSFVGKMIKASIYEVTNGETIFIGIMKNKKKINYKTTAGKHTFMVVGESADFMEAKIIGGKTYYSMITPRMGAWKARFSMIPIRNDGTTEFNTSSDKYKKWVKKTKESSIDKKSKMWFEKHKDKIEKKRVKYWAKWLEKSTEGKAARTLNPDDGI